MALVLVLLLALPLAAAWNVPPRVTSQQTSADTTVDLAGNGDAAAGQRLVDRDEVPLLHRLAGSLLGSNKFDPDDAQESAGGSPTPCPNEEASVAPIFVIDAGSSGSRLSQYNMCADGRVKKTSFRSLGLKYGNMNPDAFIDPPLAEFLRPGADVAAMQERFAQDLARQLRSFEGFDDSSATEVFIFGTGGVREASNGSPAAELTDQFRTRFLASVPQLLAGVGLPNVAFSVEILDELEEARLEAQAAMKAMGGRMDLVGVVGAGGSSFQLTELASGFAESTPWGARNVFAEDDAYGRFRALFTQPTAEGFLSAFEAAYGEGVRGKRSLGAIRSSIEANELPFHGTWVVMSGLCLSAQDVPGMEEYAKNCLAAEVNKPVAVSVAREYYLRFVLEFVRRDEPRGSVPPERRRSPASAAVMLWHLLRFFSDDAELYFAKKVEGIDLSVNAGYALRRFTCSSTFVV